MPSAGCCSTGCTKLAVRSYKYLSIVATVAYCILGMIAASHAYNNNNYVYDAVPGDGIFVRSESKDLTALCGHPALMRLDKPRGANAKLNWILVWIGITYIAAMRIYQFMKAVGPDQTLKWWQSLLLRVAIVLINFSASSLCAPALYSCGEVGSRCSWLRLLTCTVCCVNVLQVVFLIPPSFLSALGIIFWSVGALPLFYIKACRSDTTPLDDKSPSFTLMVVGFGMLMPIFMILVYPISMTSVYVDVIQGSFVMSSSSSHIVYVFKNLSLYLLLPLDLIFGAILDFLKCACPDAMRDRALTAMV
jgi:hypothetical protein